MLILTRRLGEVVVIGGQTEVTLVRIRRMAVDLTVQASVNKPLGDRRPEDDAVYTLRLGEERAIGKNQGVTVLGIKGNQVRLGFDVPRDISVHRKEIQNRIDRETQGVAHAAR